MSANPVNAQQTGGAGEPDVGVWVRRLVEKAVAEQVHAWRRYADLVGRLASGALDEAAVREEVARFSRDETARYARGAAAIALSCSDALLDLERARTDAFFDGVLGAPPGTRDPARDEPGPDEPAGGVPAEPLPDLVLSGVAGGEATAAFVVDNAEPQPASIAFAVSDFAPSDGGAPFRPPLVAEPESFVVPPGGSRRVTLRVALVADLFPRGRSTATLRVRGRDDLDVRLAVDVLDEERGAPEGAVELDRQADGPPGA